jgi:hypothetical protein
MTSPQDRDTLYKTIDSEARDDRESRETKVLYALLEAHKRDLSAAAGIPANDAQLDKKILHEAAKRSAQITGELGRAISGRRPPSEGRPIPFWVILLWIATIVGVILAYMMIVRK